MRRSSMIAAVSLAAMASAPPAAAGGDPKPGTVVTVPPSDQQGPVIDNESTVFLQNKLLGGAAGSERVYFTITFQQARLAVAPPPAGNRWTTDKAADQAAVAKVDSFTVKQGVKPYMHYKLDRVFVKSWSTSGDAAPIHYPGGVTVASGDVGGDNARVRPSDLTMKRGTGPAAGSRGINRLTVVSTRTGDCAVGKHYPEATMEGGGKRYAFIDVTITGCAPSDDRPKEEITFVYGHLG